MVNPNLKQALLFIGGIAAIVAVAKCQMVETTWDRAGSVMAEKRSRYTTELTVEELNKFIKDWPDFNELKILKGADLTGIEAKISEIMTWKMRLWFVYHHWDAERFFYVRDRLEVLLEEVKIRREAKNIIKQLSTRKDELSMQMVDLQRKRIKSLKISEKELLMLLARERELKEMFKQYP